MSNFEPGSRWKQSGKMSPTDDLSTPFLPVTCVSPSPQSASYGPSNREQAGAGEQCASESGVCEPDTG
jgi:hypothetical protein